MITQKEIDVLVKKEYNEMASFINEIEQELIKPEDEFNRAKVAVYFGILQEKYREVGNFMGWFNKEEQA